MNCKLRLPGVVLACCIALLVQAQPQPPYKIAVMAPLYLDTAFNGYTYQLGNKTMPQQIMAGLDFYNGVMLAVDSLQKERANIEVWIYDTRKKTTDINAILKSMGYQNFALIIGSFTTMAEQKAVSDFSFGRNIPVISSTFPNDAGIVENPYFAIVNSTLSAHVSGIYNYIQQNYAGAKPVFITRSGSLESRIAADFKASDSMARFRSRYRTLTLSDGFTVNTLRQYLDSTRQNVLVCGSLNTAFARDLAAVLCDNPQYKTTLFGMPNWDALRGLTSDCESLEFIYTSPYNFSRTDSVGYAIAAAYKAKFYARPSDMVFKGYEAMYHFTHLLLTYKNEMIAHLSDRRFNVSSNFNFQPVYTGGSAVPAYQENKNLYFIKKVNGSVVSVSR